MATSYCRRILTRRLPILQWSPTYNTHKCISDTIAGITVGLTVIPQALAYASLAGLQPQFGLYSAFVGCFIYFIFGTCKDITIGPTALLSLMTYQQVMNRNSDYAVLLCFLSGIVQILMAVLRLGVLVDFISIPVTVGFTSATSVIIATSQLKSLLGLKISSSGFLDTVMKFFQKIDETRFTDLFLGIGCIVVLLLLRKLKNFQLNDVGQKPTTRQKYWNQTFWLIGTSRNALVVLLCSVAGYIYKVKGDGSPFVLTGEIKPGLPSIQLPPFQTVMNNHTIGFSDMVMDLGSSIFLVPIIAVLGNVAIAKAFASGAMIDATQELFCLSMCNVIGSFFSSMPITGSFSRSAVNHASGVQTPAGGIFTSVLVLLALSFLTPYFAFIPKTSLAAVIISAVIFMIEYEVVKPMWRSSKKDLISAFATFFVCLIVGVEYGILVGVAINIIFLLYPSVRPTVIVETKKTSSDIEYLMITPGNSLYFPAVDFIKTSVGKAGVSSRHLPVVIDCRYILGADFTAAKGISALINDFSARKQPLYFFNTRKEVVTVFQGVLEEDFKYFTTSEELDNTLKENQFDDRSNEQGKLLYDTESEYCSDKWRRSAVELREICNGDGNNLSHRLNSVQR